MSSFLFSVVSSLILASTMSVFQISIQISLIKKLFCGINKGRFFKLTPYQKAVHVSAIGYGFLGFDALCLVILRVHDLAINSVANYYSDIHIIVHSLYMMLAGCAFISHYIFGVSRLYVTFEDSSYKIKTITMYIHFGTLIFICISSLSMVIMAKLQIFDTAQILNTLFGVVVALALLAQIHLIYAFNYRLFRMALDKRQATSPNDSDKIGLTQAQRNILSVVRKHTLLGVLLILIMFVGIIAYIAAVNIYSKSENARDERISYQNYLVMGTYLNSTWYIVFFDIINVIAFNTVTLCVYLGFSVNKSYYKFLCKSLDTCCKHFCESCVQCRMDANNYENVTALQTTVLETSHHTQTSENDTTINHTQTESTF